MLSASQRALRQVQGDRQFYDPLRLNLTLLQALVDRQLYKPFRAELVEAACLGGSVVDELPANGHLVCRNACWRANRLGVKVALKTGKVVPS